ncbi:MAG: hypothetical protein HYV97_08580 [Bdellovibrio sp.]|nr:hypothetical protein [Bdellovibrio sp.]
MDTILAGASEGSNPIFTTVLFLLAGMRLYMEMMGFKLAELPVSKALFGEQAKNFHRYGLYMSIGYVILFAPAVLLGYGG